MKQNLRVCAIHDIVGLGRCSLTMILPVLSAMGIVVCPVPTAVFSAHTRYPNPERQPLDDFMRHTLERFAAEGVAFDAAYSGYLGGAGQIQAVLAFMRAQKGLRVVDPVFGDNGKLYASVTPDMVEGMRGLIAEADIITPNLTEAAFLLGREPKEALDRAEERAWLTALRALGPRGALITSCRRAGESGTIAVLGADSAGGAFRVIGPELPAQFSGNGDLFAAVLTGGMLRGLSLPEAARCAAGFVCAAMRETIEAGTPVIEGVRLEQSLGLLMHPPEYSDILIEEIDL